MSSRYGRNKRRAARERIAALERDLREATAKVQIVSQSYARAKEDGASEILRIQHLDQVTERLAYELTRAYGPKLMDAAHKLLASDRGRKPIDIRAILDVNATYAPEVWYVQGSIPSLHYRVALSSW